MAAHQPPPEGSQGGSFRTTVGYGSAPGAGPGSSGGGASGAPANPQQAGSFHTTVGYGSAPGAGPGSSGGGAGAGSSGSLEQGSLIGGRYPIQGLLGKGGMGQVFRSHHPALDFPLAIKVMLPDLARDQNLRDRFLQEARLAARIAHPNLVKVCDCGFDGGMLWLAMELVEGQSLEARLAKGPLPVGHAVTVIKAAAEALQAANQQYGIIHRDVKPENIVVREAGGRLHTKVVDLGLAKVAEFREGLERTQHALTQPGAVIGTPYYMAPEQIHAVPDLDCRADIFSLGGTFYAALAGEPPFRGNSRFDVFSGITSRQPPPLPDGIPKAVRQVVLRMLAKDRERRFQDYAELIAALDAIGPEAATAKRGGSPKPLLIGAVVFLVLAGIGGFALTRKNGDTAAEGSASGPPADVAKATPAAPDSQPGGDTVGGATPEAAPASVPPPATDAAARGAAPTPPPVPSSSAPPSGPGREAAEAPRPAPSAVPVAATAPAASPPPLPPLTFVELRPAAGSRLVLRSPGLEVSGRLSDPAAGPVWIGEPGGPGMEKGVDAEGRFVAYPGLDPGATAIEVRAGRPPRETTARIEVTIDADPPKVRFTGGLDTWGGGPLTVAVRVDDRHPELVRFRLEVDGEPVGLPLERGVAADGTAQVTFAVPAGARSLAVLAEARDVAGHTSTARADIPIDRTGPAVQIVEPVAGLLTRGASVRLEVRLARAEGPVRVQVEAEGAAPLVREIALPPDGEPLRVPELPLPAGDGRARIGIEVCDRVGNVGRTSVEVLMDRTPPTLVVDAEGPLPRDAAEARIRVRSSEPLTSLVIDGEERVRGGSTWAEGSCAVRVAPGAESVVVRARGTDAAGNVSSEVAVAVAREAAPVGPPEGIGWHGEVLPKGMRRAAEEGVYLWSAPGGLAIPMVYVPAGDFTMGSDAGGPGEKPQHTRSSPEAFYIGRYETTWAEFKAFARATGRELPEVPAWAGDDHPVANVTLDDAVAFCTWAGLALPTEPQWEKAARGTDGRRYPWGNELPNADDVWRCNYSEGGVGGSAADGFANTAPVGSFARYPSPYGAHDLAGNVSEWCAGFFDAASYEQYARWKTPPPQSGALRVYRGGGWYDPASATRSSTRHDTRWPSNRSAHVGFRPATAP